MTVEEVVSAINASGLKPEELTLVLSFAAALVNREKLRAAMARTREEQASANQQYETAIQGLQEQFNAIEKALAAQS